MRVYVDMRPKEKLFKCYEFYLTYNHCEEGYHDGNIFADIAEYFIQEYPSIEGGYPLLTEEEFKEEVEYWKKEVLNANKGTEYTEFLVPAATTNLDEWWDKIYNHGDYWYFAVSEIKYENVATC
jgi:hypothetical protein